MSFSNLYNKTHKMQNGMHVTYRGVLDRDKTFVIAAIGSNKSGRFTTASVCFSLAAEPNYNIGPFDEDTSLFVTLSGKGRIANGRIAKVKGTVAGTIGCGCFAYGHVSPTRAIWLHGVSSLVTDVAAVHGTWRMTAVK